MDTNQPQPESPQAAQERIGALRSDPTFTSRLLAGDAGAKAEWTKLHEVGFGNEAATADGISPIEPSGPQGKPVASSVAPVDALRPGDYVVDGEYVDGPMTEPPRGAWEYDFTLYGAEANDTQLAHEFAMKNALYEVGVPAFLASFGRTVIERNIRDGITIWASEAATARARSELEQRHGEAGAKQIIADSKKVFDRIDAKSAAAGDVLCNSGALNCPDFIEALARTERHYYAKKIA